MDPFWALTGTKTKKDRSAQNLRNPLCGSSALAQGTLERQATHLQRMAKRKFLYILSILLKVWPFLSKMRSHALLKFLYAERIHIVAANHRNRNKIGTYIWPPLWMNAQRTFLIFFYLRPVQEYKPEIKKKIKKGKESKFLHT